jgi:hypothetical protein
MGGIGNYIAGVLSCLATAIATNRSLLLADPPPQPANRPRYDDSIATLFDFPIDTSLDPLGVPDVPLVMDEHNDPSQTGLQVCDRLLL